MTENELKSMTVVQLKQYAKENHITLGAGLDKAGIVAKIYAAEQDQPAGELSEQQSFLAPAEQEPAVPAEEVREEEPPAEPKFQAAWHNTDAPRYSAKPSYQAPGAPSFGPRPAWQSTTPSGRQLTSEQQHIQPKRPGSFTPRFGPAAASPACCRDLLT